MAGIGFFAPLPLAMMMPFMAGQSLMMGDAFGKSYQYGKRKISAMSNEEFNKLSMEDLSNDIDADFRRLIPSMKIAMARSTEFQSLIIQEMGNIIKSLPSEITKFFGGEGNATSSSIEVMVIALLAKMLNIPTIPGAFGSSTPNDPTIPVTPTIPSSAFDEPIGPPSTPPPGFNIIGPQIPPGGIIPPQQDNTLVIDSDGNIINKDVRAAVGAHGTLRAPTSIIQRFNKYNAEAKAMITTKGRFPSNSYFTTTTFPKEMMRINNAMLALWKKYNLHGKVQFQYYTGPNPLV